MFAKLTKVALFFLALIALIFSSCTKAVNDEDSVSAEDANNISSVLSATMDDAANSMSSSPYLSGKTDGMFEEICGASLGIDSVRGIVNFAYNGADCTGKISRKGSVTVTLLNHAAGARWKDSGAILETVFTNMQFIVNKTGAVYTINGTHYLINETGGRPWELMDGLAAGTVILKHVSNNFAITFPNGRVRTWSVNRIRSFANTVTVKTQTLNGDTTVNGYTNIDVWGTNRNGDEFYASLISPLVGNSTCGYPDPLSGEYTHHVANRNVDVLFGVDSDGNPISPGQCAYGYKITYSSGRKTLSKIDPYWF
jgi:hypothetical protein